MSGLEITRLKIERNNFKKLPILGISRNWGIVLFILAMGTSISDCKLVSNNKKDKFLASLNVVKRFNT
jgi:hypothetical protein